MPLGSMNPVFQDVSIKRPFVYASQTSGSKQEAPSRRAAKVETVHERIWYDIVTISILPIKLLYCIVAMFVFAAYSVYKKF